MSGLRYFAMTTHKGYGVESPCNAPFNNMYFTVVGQVSPCWKLPGFVDNWSENRSIMDIWKGDKFNQYREALKKNVFLNRCQECKKDIDNGVWPLAKAYETFPVREYPSLMELELSNQCNLECVMCSGMLSSGIRKNRDKLPPLPQVYDHTFVDQLQEFVPHLKELRFNGGEPFAQKIVLDICDMVANINPGLKINIATNGTVYNKRVEKILQMNNIHLNISIDSLIKERYEAIRINGDFDQLMANFKIFHKYSIDGNKQLSVMVNPMRNNWEEMVDFLEFTNNYNVSLWYNTILYPSHLAIWNLDSDKLKEIYDTLVSKLEQYVDSVKDKPVKRNNIDTTEHLIKQQIKTWLLDSYAS